MNNMRVISKIGAFLTVTRCDVICLTHYKNAMFSR